MRICLEGNRLLLGRGQAVGLRNGRGARLQVLQGTLWVTQEGDRRDFFVDRSEKFEIQRDGVTVLHALQTADVRVHEARQWSSRWSAWWRARARSWARKFVEAGMHRALTSRAYRL